MMTPFSNGQSIEILINMQRMTLHPRSLVDSAQILSALALYHTFIQHSLEAIQGPPATVNSGDTGAIVQLNYSQKIIDEETKLELIQYLTECKSPIHLNLSWSTFQSLDAASEVAQALSRREHPLFFIDVSGVSVATPKEDHTARFLELVLESIANIKFNPDIKCTCKFQWCTITDKVADALVKLLSANSKNVQLNLSYSPISATTFQQIKTTLVKHEDSILSLSLPMSLVKDLFWC